MNAHDAIKNAIETSSGICMSYIGDLNDSDLLRRPAPGCNHINWQLGHLIVSENHMMALVAPDAVPPLPAGFAEKYTKETATLDKPSAFCPKAELLRVQKEQRDATLAVLDTLSPQDLDRPSGVEWAPNLGAVIAGQGAHWLMHAGQWAVVRRQLGHPPLF